VDAGETLGGERVGEPVSLEAAEDGGRRSVFDRFVGGLNSIGTVWIFALMVLINLDILGRALFNRPVPGVFEIVEVSIVGIVFLQVGHTLRVGRLTRSETIFSGLIARVPRFGHFLGAFYELTGAVLFALLLRGTMPRVADAWSQNFYVGDTGIFRIPIWPIYLLIAIGCAVMILQFIVQAIAHGRQVIGTGAPSQKGAP
jgi:TRAP-type mannitol/chloroaromatic compound transport system permease small subunit